jgi:predicted aldo/keto reductase-like oxidoreductase
MRLPGNFGRIDIAKSEQLILKAIEGGVNYFDTAYLYPGSEEALGRILESNGLRDKVHIATKLPQSIGIKTEDFDKFFYILKKRLRTDYIDYYLMHNITSYKQWQALVEQGIEDWIAKKKANGEIRQIGFSFHGQRDEFPEIIDAYDWDFVQIQYNYINTNYQAGAKGLKKAAEKGLSVIIMEPLLGGKLATGLPKEAAALFKKADPESTPVSWALRWLWNHSEVTVLLSGMNDPSQLEENLRLADASAPGMLSTEEIQTVEKVVKVFNESYKIPCTGCNYCMPCPKKINIPGFFSAYNASYAIGRSTGIMQYMTSSDALGKESHFASDCIECGKCEKHCPQGIKIRNELKAVKRRLQVPGIGVARTVAHRFIRK